jgi:hypothetical protein
MKKGKHMEEQIIGVGRLHYDNERFHRSRVPRCE